MTAVTPLVPTFAIAQQYRPKDAVVVEIVGPDKQPTPIRITLAGRYTPAFKAALAVLATADETASDEEAFDRIVSLLVAATTAWEGVLDGEGNALPCEAHTVRALYTHPELGWLWAQVRDAFNDTARFFENAKAS